jgi:hypothetical protein
MLINIIVSSCWWWLRLVGGGRGGSAVLEMMVVGVDLIWEAFNPLLHSMGKNLVTAVRELNKILSFI